MTVRELIEKLQECPPYMEVMLDISKQNTEGFVFASVRDASEVTDSMGDNYILITPFEMDEPNLS